MKLHLALLLLLACSLHGFGQQKGLTRVPVGLGWAGNSINTVVFRSSSLASLGKWQYIAYYNQEGHVVLGKRNIHSRRWQLDTTRFTGNIRDAHNCISIAVDGAGYLHMAWDHHNNRLHYTRSKQPGSLGMEDEMPMTGQVEDRVTYPAFYRLPGGDLLFLYRDGQSGRGNLVVNRYDVATRAWRSLHTNLISGEGERNAYWQACVDEAGTVHLSWTWRESPDVASNHDICYARSTDGGLSWQRSNGSSYTLPITAATAEYAARIPQNSELINQTSMTTLPNGAPLITTYWRSPANSIPQYRLVYLNGATWQTLDGNWRTTPFSLSGAGTKAIPISRPLVLAYSHKKEPYALLVYRDTERGSRVSYAMVQLNKPESWIRGDLDTLTVQAWEPTADIDQWQKRKQLHLFVQPVVQADAEGLKQVKPTAVEVWTWKVPGKRVIK